MLEKVIYLADYIEPGRDFSKTEPDSSAENSLSNIRRLAFTDIDRAVALTAMATLKYIREGKPGQPISELTVKTFEYYS